MFRIIGGVLLGYVTMAACVLASFSAAYLTMGTERAFAPGSYEVTPLWLVTSSILAIFAAVVGGVVCALISKNQKGTIALACVVLILGLVMVYPVWTRSQEEPKIRTGEVGNFEAMDAARQPVWVAVMNPLIGVLGALGGGRLILARRPSTDGTR